MASEPTAPSDPVAEEEALQTTAEKESWLRARGVEIESPEDRRKAAESKAKLAHPLDHVEGVTRRVKYVKIPCDASNPFEQLEAILAHDAHGDILPDVLAPRFAGGGSIDSNAAREQAVRQLGAKGLELSSSALENATKQGSAETFALVRPSATNGHRGVYLYLDEVGLLKSLPPNARADGLARACGFDGVSFYGDMYIGAVQSEPSPMHNADFTVRDLDSSAEWLRRAGSENFEYNQSMKQLQDAMREKGGMVGSLGGDGDGGAPSGEGEGYVWTQTDDEVEVVVNVPAGTKAKDVHVTFKPRSLTVGLKGASPDAKPLVSLTKTFRATRPDESTWTMDGERVIVTVAKMDEQVWHELEGLGE